MSLISDLYQDKHRGVATAVLHLGVYLGFGLSQAAGIYLTKVNVLGFSWRIPYFITGIPGVLFGILLIILTDPRNEDNAIKVKEDKEENFTKLLGSPAKIIRPTLMKVRNLKMFYSFACSSRIRSSFIGIETFTCVLKIFVGIQYFQTDIFFLIEQL